MLTAPGRRSVRSIRRLPPARPKALVNGQVAQGEFDRVEVETGNFTGKTCLVDDALDDEFRMMVAASQPVSSANIRANSSDLSPKIPRRPGSKWSGIVLLLPVSMSFNAFS